MKRLFLILALILTACGAPALAPLATPNSNDIQLSGSISGTYTVSKSGTASDPIIVWGNGVRIDGKKNFDCVLITGSYVVFRDAYISNCGSFGVRVKGKHVVVENNVITMASQDNFNGTACIGGDVGWGTGGRAADTDDVIFRGNLVFETCGEGLSAVRSTNVLIENNVVRDAFSVNIYVDQSSFVTVRNNWSYSTGDARFYKALVVARGIAIGAEIYPAWTFNVHDILIENNLLERVRGINYIVEQAGTPFNVTVRNNNFITVAAPLVSLGTWATVSGNISVTPTPGGTAVTMTPSPTVAVTSTPSATPSRTPTPTQTATPTATATGAVTIMPTITPTPCSIMEDDDFTIWIWCK